MLGSNLVLTGLTRLGGPIAGNFRRIVQLQKQQDQTTATSSFTTSSTSLLSSSLPSPGSLDTSIRRTMSLGSMKRVASGNSLNRVRSATDLDAISAATTTTTTSRAFPSMEKRGVDCGVVPPKDFSFEIFRFKKL